MAAHGGGRTDAEADAGDGGDADTDSGSDSPYPDAPSFDEDDPAPCGSGTVWEQILEPTEADALARLSTLSGYATGGLAIYRGTATAHDNRGIAYTTGNGELTGEVLAKLEPSTDGYLPEPGDSLTVKSLEEPEYFEIFRTTDGATTLLSAVTPWTSTPIDAIPVTQIDEAPAFVDRPESLTFDMSASGEELVAGVPLEIEA
ncbi:MAG TPA: hypothetical protein VF103_16165, partial [Polyangiaceae bacterium]